jgi:hypothetical protein
LSALQLHGVFSEIDLAQQIAVKCAFDAKQLHRCAELGQMHVHGAWSAFLTFQGFSCAMIA